MHHSYIDKYSNLNSFIHRIDPRIKLITSIIFILFVVLTPLKGMTINLYIDFILYGVLLGGLILLSKIPLIFIFKRLLIMIPFIVVIAVFILFQHSNESIILFLNILIKAYLSSMMMILLVNSTRFSDLLKASKELKCPKLITMILSFMYRYIFLIIEELMAMKRAKISRSVGGSRVFHLKALSNMLGVLFIKSYEKGETVYLAMCSRGFNGQIKTISDFKLRSIDYCFFFTILSMLISIRFLN